jgi:hypothetical protein
MLNSNEAMELFKVTKSVCIQFYSYYFTKDNKKHFGGSTEDQLKSIYYHHTFKFDTLKNYLYENFIMFQTFVWDFGASWKLNLFCNKTYETSFVQANLTFAWLWKLRCIPRMKFFGWLTWLLLVVLEEGISTHGQEHMQSSWMVCNPPFSYGPWGSKTEFGFT